MEGWDEQYMVTISIDVVTCDTSYNFHHSCAHPGIPTLVFKFLNHLFSVSNWSLLSSSPRTTRSFLQFSPFIQWAAVTTHSLRHFHFHFHTVGSSHYSIIRSLGNTFSTALSYMANYWINCQIVQSLPKVVALTLVWGLIRIASYKSNKVFTDVDTINDEIIPWCLHVL